MSIVLSSKYKPWKRSLLDEVSASVSIFVFYFANKPVLLRNVTSDYTEMDIESIKSSQ